MSDLEHSSDAASAPPAVLSALAEDANTRLETLSGDAAQQAFNLGCLVGLLPAVILGVVIFLATGFSLIGSILALILGVVSAIAFANLAAMLARQNTLRRAFHDTINPDIERALLDAGYTRADFDQAVRQTLPAAAVLTAFLPPPPGEPAAAGAGRFTGIKNFLRFRR